MTRAVLRDLELGTSKQAGSYWEKTDSDADADSSRSRRAFESREHAARPHYSNLCREDAQYRSLECPQDLMMVEELEPLGPGLGNAAYAVEKE